MERNGTRAEVSQHEACDLKPQSPMRHLRLAQFNSGLRAHKACQAAVITTLVGY
jgi:hypothetical protein